MALQPGEHPFVAAGIYRMSSVLILTCVVLYSLMLFGVVWYTSRKASNDTYFIGNRESKWYVVAYGMIGASLSGVTFMSLPGWVGTTHFTYMMVVFGYFFGYMTIAYVLLPLYYRLKLTSIYTYLDGRMGFWSYKTGAFYFLLSRTIGAAFRVYIVVNVLQTFVLDAWNVPFWITVTVFIALILLYTYKGGVKTIVWTDTLQTTFMLLSVVLSVVLIAQALGFGWSDVFRRVFQGEYAHLVNTDWQAKNHFLKHFFGGMFIAIAMTGLDQEMMQKNISVKTLPDSQKNMVTFSLVLIVINFLFLVLGVMLYTYSTEHLQPGALSLRTSDDLFPSIALHYLGTGSAIFFIIGLISAAYPSADGALTALTASFCIDFLNVHKRDLTEAQRKKIRYTVHISFAVILLAVVVVFRIINDAAVIGLLFTAAGYTYGPILGLFAFGVLTRRAVQDRWTPVVCVLSPVLCFVLNENANAWLNGYQFGFEMLIVNGLLTFCGLYAVSRRT